MKVIDAHLHFRPESENFQRLALQAEHENSLEHLQEVYHKLGIEHAVVMGSRNLAAPPTSYPSFLSYCMGIDSDALSGDKQQQALAQAELHLARQDCVGFKVYAGYTFRDVYDPGYAPFYRLAEAYNKPVAVHTGVTAHPRALLRYSHPLQLDEAAVTFPQVTFVMCHFGNPWLADAAAVLEKNPN
ncbi:MAG: amidohydrolase family protein, partial [Symbiobacteriaceae bacterium]|nr:amidohydrolase family protein [Symbiobacteriaceae bacterium]